MGTTYDKLQDELFLHKHTIEDISDLDQPLQFKGEINANTDFPLIADVTNGWFYTIGTDVTDDAGVLYTNTGQSFVVNDDIAWNGTDWSLLGSTDIYTAGSVPFAGADGILTEDNAKLFWNSSTNKLNANIDMGTF